MKSLNLCIALTVAVKGEEDAAERIADRIGTSIKNGGIAIYNGNHETQEMPIECDTWMLHPAFKENPEDFGGWKCYREVRMLDFAKCGKAQQRTLLEQHFSPEIVEAWENAKPDFSGPDTVAIRVEADYDGDEADEFYEYIINKSA